MNVYDFDGTIYDGDSTVDFYRFALKKRPSLVRYLPKQMAGFFMYAVGHIDKTQLKEHFFCFLSGINADELTDIFWNEHEHKIYSWYPDQQASDDIVISASPEFLLAPVCSRLGITRLIASKVDSRTGKFIGENCRGREKVLRLKRELDITHIDNFYSDSVSDLPLAEIADHAFLVSKGTVDKWNLED